MGKPVKHQSTNTFKFQSFHERIKKVDPTVGIKLGKHLIIPQDADTHFAEALTYWTDINCTQHFVDFQREVVGRVQSHAQLLFYKGEIAKTLQRHLEIPNSLALQALLDLVIQFARDLQDDFLVHFEPFFIAFIRQLSVRHHDVDALEWIFTCLAMLIKFLWRYLVKDLGKIYSIISPLLSSTHYREYINAFAAESFSYLMRKVKNKSELFDMIFASLKANRDQVEGVGCLLFEMIKKSHHQFFFCASEVFSLLLEKLRSVQDSDGKVIFGAIKKMWTLMSEHLHVSVSTSHLSAEIVSEQSALVMHAMLTSLSNSACEESESSHHFACILELLHIWISFHGGILVSDQTKLVQVLVELFDNHLLPSGGRYWLLKVVSTVLISTAFNLEMRHRSALLTAVYGAGYCHPEVFVFTENVFGITLFEKDVLPGLIQYCQNGMLAGAVLPCDILSMFASLLLHKLPPCAGFTATKTFLHSYTIDFRPEIKRNPSNVTHMFTKWIEDELSSVKKSLPIDCLSLTSLWAIAYCLPHIVPISTDSVVSHLAELISSICGTVSGGLISEANTAFIYIDIITLTGVKPFNQPLLLLLEEVILSIAEEAMRSLCYMVGVENLTEHVSVGQLEKLLVLYPTNISCLRLVDLFVTCAQTVKKSEDILSTQLFGRIFSSLEMTLSYPISMVRVLSLHIFCQFNMPLPSLPLDVELEQRGVFNICLDAEMSSLSALTDRIRLNHLRRLDQEYIHHQLNIGVSDQVPLRFLIGQLYVNFAPLWSPVRTLIKSYAVGLSRESFWEVYGSALTDAAKQICNTSAVQGTFYDTLHSTSKSGKLFVQYQHMRAGTPDRPDYINFRQQLWMAMQEFPSECESRSRVIVPLFLSFLENEYFPGDSTMAATQDIRCTSSNVLEDDVDENEDDAEEPEGNIMSQNADDRVGCKRKKSKEYGVKCSKLLKTAQVNKMEGEMCEQGDQIELSFNSSSNTVTKKKRKVKTASDKVLIIHLKLFAMFRDPKSLVQQGRLHELYLELLKSKSPDVQKAAFDCIMTYKHKYLVPYRDNFERLIDEKTFRNEIVLFSIDKSNSVINEDHHGELVPVLMRILYGKMRLKSGRDSSSNLQAQARKSTVMAFIASSQPCDIETFFNLVFQPFQQLFLDDIERQVLTLFNEVDVSRVIPLRKQQSILDTVVLVMHKFGTLAGNYLPRLLQIIICVAASSAALLSRRDEVQVNLVNLLKSLRQKAISALCEFFASFSNYPYSSAEIEAVFVAAVWPQLDKLAVEGIYSPTGLLRLFHVWSKNPRYVPLLSKYRPEQPDVTPLSCTFSLLHSKSRTADSVIGLVMDIVDNLLSWEDEDEQEENQVGPIVTNWVYTESVNSSCPFGTALLLPHVPIILEYLHVVVKKFSSSGSTQQGKFRAPPAVEISILSRLSEFVTDRTQSVNIVNLLLPFLGRRLKRSEEFEENLLISVKNLIVNCDQPLQLIPKLSELFSILSGRLPRRALCDVLSAIADFEPSVKKMALLASNLNAWDSRHVEEPDLTSRMEGFSEANQLLTSDEPIDVELLLVLIHNCTFFIATLDGLSGFALRDQSAECLNKIIARISRDTDSSFSSESFRVVIVRHLLTEVKANLKLKSESCRHAFIAVLESLVHYFPASPHFSDLVQLCNDKDIETDFFKNIVHVQLHRRMKAMRFLCRCLFKENAKPVKTETLTNYIMPLVTSLLRDPTFIKNSDRVDVAVETLGIIVRQLPWPRYLITLRYYLGETLKGLENQKLSVKVLTAVLDNFHFNLINSEFSINSQHSGVMSTSSSTVVDAKNEDAHSSEMIVDETTDPSTDETADVEMTETGENEADSNDATAGAGINICKASLATRIHRVIEINILPQLQKCLTKEAMTDGSHKLAVPGKYAEDEEILRVPVALAMVKLLQQLPRNALDKNLPSVLFKVCRFLCSRSRDIRISARDTLTKIVLSLGPLYFSYVLNEMSSTLKRGYQLHVLCYSVWTILKSLKPLLKPGDLDTSIVKLTEVLNSELFGQVSDEKEVEGIISKLFEAKTTKSIDSYGILATIVSSSTLSKLIAPLKTELLKTTSSRVTKKIADVLKLIGRGLIENKGLDVNTLMTFVYGLASEASTNSTCTKLPDDVVKKSTKADRRQPNALLLKAEPGRSGKKPKSKQNTNSHVLVEFGLQLLHLLLKRSHITASSKSDLQLLDPFVAILSKSLSSKYVKVMSAALRCLVWVLRMPLPSVKTYVTAITSQLFVLLNNYAGAGAGKGDNFELVVMCFKAITVLVRDVTTHKITDKQLHVLLVYAKQDLNDFSRQAAAFSVLKAIISRKLVAPEMEDIIREVERMSIVSEAHNIQQQCRQIAWQFMLDYPLGNKLVKHLEFYLQQLQFEHESGRICALEMLSTIFNSFPQNVLNEYSGLFFTSVAARVVNDESTTCRQMSAAAIKLLLNKLDNKQKDLLFDMVIQWMQSSKPSLLTLSAKVAGLFTDVEGTSFRRHIPAVLPLIEQNIVPEKYKEHSSSDKDQHALDLRLFDFLTLLLKIVQSCSDDLLNVCWLNNQWSEILDRIWESVEVHLVHCHDWIKLVSSQLFKELFLACRVDQLVLSYVLRINNELKSNGLSNVSNYLATDIWKKLRDLSTAFCRQLSCPNLTQQLGSEIVHCLLHVTRILRHLSMAENDIKISANGSHEDHMTLLWLIKRVVREIKKETSGYFKSTAKRKNVYIWLMGVATILGSNGVSEYLPHILRPLVREMTDNSPNAEPSLKSCCQETLELVKQLAGSDEFSRKYAMVQQAVSVQRQERKTQRSVEAVTNPALSARRKMKKNIKKKEAKKRKIADIRPSKKSKRHKMAHEHLASVDTF